MFSNVPNVLVSTVLFLSVGFAHAAVTPLGNPNQTPATGAAAADNDAKTAQAEAERLNRLMNAQDETDFLDNATGPEIAEAYGLDQFPKIEDADRPTPEQVANAAMTVVVSLSRQRLKVTSGVLTDTWKISSGMDGYETTPGGPFFAQHFSPNHVSTLYPINRRTGKRGGAKMGNTIFHNGDQGFHATKLISKLGHRDSHGCIRSSYPDNNRLYAAAEYYYNTLGPKSVIFIINP